MTETITVIVDGEQKEEQIQTPNILVLKEHFKLAPLPMTFDTETVVWMQASLFLATDLSLGEVKQTNIISGIHSIEPILKYWVEVINEKFNGEKGGEIKLPEEDLSLDGFDLNWDGSVDLEEMR